MPNRPEDKKRALARVKRLKGQLEALERALSQQDDCSAILQQIAAIRGAVGGLMLFVLEAHLRDTFGEDAPSPQDRDEQLESINELLRSYLK